MTLTVQFQTMLFMIAAGVWIGGNLDTYRRFFRRNKHVRWLVFLFDLLFWIVQALLVFYILLHINNGQIRFYIFLAILCGFAAYQALFRGMYVLLLEKLISFFVALSRFVLKLTQLFIFKPIIMLYHGILILLLFIIQFVWKVISFLFWICFFPFRLIGKAIWRFTPKKVKNFSLILAGKYTIVKNKLHKWIATLRS